MQGNGGWYEQVVHACALQDVVNLPDFSNGTIGSGGARLSGGQRQRLVGVYSFHCHISSN
jgi:ABC-type bacteriocin/lantibiotic exporter with double-glycine peptidase domain